MIKTNERILSFIGLACKAGKVASGNQACEDAIKKRKAFLVLLSGDIAANSEKDYTLAAQAGVIPCFKLETEELGNSIGKPERKVVCIIGKEFANIIIKEIDLLNNFGGVEQ